MWERTKMGTILKNTVGVISCEIPQPGLVVVVFDDQRTSPAKIAQAMEKGRSSLQGKPVYVPLGATLSPVPDPGAPSRSCLSLYMKISVNIQQYSCLVIHVKWEWRLEMLGFSLCLQEFHDPADILR